jgi:hypothetical protein
VQLLVDVVQVNFNRAFSDPKLFRDNFIREPLRDQPGNLCFPFCYRLIANTISRPTICIVGHSTLLSGMTHCPPRIYLAIGLSRRGGRIDLYQTVNGADAPATIREGWPNEKQRYKYIERYI